MDWGCQGAVSLIDPTWGSNKDVIDVAFSPNQGYKICSSWIINTTLGTYDTPCLLGGISSCTDYSSNINCPKYTGPSFNNLCNLQGNSILICSDYATASVSYVKCQAPFEAVVFALNYCVYGSVAFGFLYIATRWCKRQLFGKVKATPDGVTVPKKGLFHKSPMTEHLDDV